MEIEKNSKNILSIALLASLVVFTALAIASTINIGESSFKKYSDICHGDLVLSDDDGLVYKGPESCGNYKFTMTKIDFHSKPGLRGVAWLWGKNFAFLPSHAGGDFGVIEINEKLPPCMKEIVVKKEWQHNGGAFGYLVGNGSMNEYIEPTVNGYKLNDAGFAFIDAVAVHEAAINTSDVDRKCMFDYDKDFDQSYFDRALSLQGLGELSEDGEFSKDDLCTTYKAALNHLEEIDNDHLKDQIIKVQSEIGCVEN